MKPFSGSLRLVSYWYIALFKSNIRVAIFLSIGVGIFGGNLWAQERTDAAGGNATGAGGSVSYSIGLIDYITATGSSGIITQGVQQPYEIFIVGIKDGEANSSIMAYPNPVAEIVVVDVGELRLEYLRYVLYDLHGKILKTAAIEAHKTEISLAGFARASYLLKIMEGDVEVQVFKLIKN